MKSLILSLMLLGGTAFAQEIGGPPGGGGGDGGGGGQTGFVRFACVGTEGLLWFSQTSTVEQALANCLGAGGIGIIVQDTGDIL